MNDLSEEAHLFRHHVRERSRMAAALAAFSIHCGVDLESALRLPHERRRCLTMRLERIIERERIKGAKRHWSYDLNRHIGLKQALDMLRQGVGEKLEEDGRPPRKRRNGIRRRRARPASP